VSATLEQGERCRAVQLGAASHETLFSTEEYTDKTAIVDEMSTAAEATDCSEDSR
jgi:hypothetical protein